MSFCNLSAAGPALGLFDFDSGELGWVSSPAENPPWVGVDGICRRDGAIWFLPQVAWGGISALARLNDSLEVDFHAPLERARDAHSLTPFQGGFLVADTQHNRLVLARPDVGAQSVAEEVFWSYCDDHEDVVHLNSVATQGGEVFVSVFGRKPSSGWAESHDGQIVHVPSGEVLCGNIAHPHSLTAVGDTLFWLESARGVLHSCRPADRRAQSVELAGFVRGLAFDGSYFYVGASARRRCSRSRGVPNAPVADTPEEAQSWIYRVRPDGSALERRRITTFGAEIYDLAIVEADAAKAFLSRSADLAAVERVWSFEDEIAKQRDEIACLVRQLAELQAQRESLRDQPAMVRPQPQADVAEI